MRQVIQEAAKWLVPYNIWNHLRQTKLDAARRKRLDQIKSAATRAERDFNRQAAVEFLAVMGCDRRQVEEGSIPQSALDYAATFLAELPQRQLRGLHVGNFVGISLAFFAAVLRKREAGSFMIGIDPNIAHRGISNPMGKVIALLEHFGLESNCMILTGYSLEKSVANDGQDYGGRLKVEGAYSPEPSCALQLII